jgi:hypothetical protein
MSEIETRARVALEPLIKGNIPPALSAEYQRHLAVWACLRSYVVESAAFRDFNAYSTREERANFAANHREVPPANTIVWLARFPGPQFLNGDICGSRLRCAVERETKINALQVFTFFLGHVAFQILQWRGDAMQIGGKHPSLASTMFPQWTGSNWSSEIWPDHRRRSALLPKVLSASQVEAFFRRFVLEDTHAATP